MQILNDKFGLSYLSGNAQILFANTGTVQQFDTILANAITNLGNTFTVNAAGIFGANLFGANVITNGNVSAANIIISGNLFLKEGFGNVGQYIRRSGTGIDWVDSSFIGGTITVPLVINNSTDSVSTTTGALTTTGGIGIAGNVWVGSSFSVSGNINIGAGGSPSLNAWGGMAATNRFYVQGDWNQVSFGTVSANGQRYARGTPGSPTSVQDTDRLGAFFFGGYHSGLNSGTGGWINPTYIATLVEGTTTGVTSALPGKLAFYTTALNDTRTLRLEISSSGNVVIFPTTTATSTTTGALVVAGGVGLAGNLHVGGNIVGRFNNLHTNQNANLYINNNSNVFLQTGTRVASGSNTTVTIAGNITTTANITANTIVYGAAVIEPVAIHAGTAPTGEMPINLLANSTHYYTPSATGNWTPNVRASASLPLNNMLSTGQQITFSMIVNQGATPRNNSSGNLRIDNTWITAKWPSAVVPTAIANRVEIYTYTIIKTANATWIVIASSATNA